MRHIKISYSDFVKEHKHLVKVLRYGTKKQQDKEALSQLKELRSKMKK